MNSSIIDINTCMGITNHSGTGMVYILQLITSDGVVVYGPYIDEFLFFITPYISIERVTS
jgi:hypothetical protein